MNRGRFNIRIGTSGWHYKHWTQRFYPVGLPKNNWLSYYAKDFDTVEINNTFYNLPVADYIKRWHSEVPDDFLYAVKANRYITHIRKLKDPSRALEKFFDRDFSSTESVDYQKIYLGEDVFFRELSTIVTSRIAKGAADRTSV